MQNPPDTGRRQSYWQRTCDCVVEPAPEKYFGFTDGEVARFTALVVARGFDVGSDVGLHLRNSLADTGTKVVVGLPVGDIEITAQEAEEAIGRPLGPSRA